MGATYLLGITKTQYKIGDDGSIALRHYDPVTEGYGPFIECSTGLNTAVFIRDMLAAGCKEISNPEESSADN